VPVLYELVRPGRRLCPGRSTTPELAADLTHGGLCPAASGKHTDPVLPLPSPSQALKHEPGTIITSTGALATISGARGRGRRVLARRQAGELVVGRAAAGRARGAPRCSASCRELRAPQLECLPGPTTSPPCRSRPACHPGFHTRTSQRARLSTPSPVHTTLHPHTQPARPGVKTGRSPKDKRVVKEPATEREVWWAGPNSGSPNFEMDERWVRVGGWVRLLVAASGAGFACITPDRTQPPPRPQVVPAEPRDRLWLPQLAAPRLCLRRLCQLGGRLAHPRARDHGARLPRAVHVEHAHPAGGC
jgi:hypothetical protein